MAIISSFQTILKDEEHLIELLDQVREEILKNWQELRDRMIKTLEKTDLWKRYVLSFERIIHFSFLCSAIDRVLLEALRRKDYRITGVLQMLASPTPSYDQAMVASHLNDAKRIIKEAEKDL